MIKKNKHFINLNANINEALRILNKLNLDNIIFVIDNTGKLIGSITDGDIRRGLLNGVQIYDNVDKVLNANPKFIRKGDDDINKIIQFREKNYKIIPIVDNEHKVLDLINFRQIKSFLPLDVLLMAGGRGQRLIPLTNSCPKPLLKVGNKSILDHNLDRLQKFGINDFWISINYLGEIIENHLSNRKGNNITYLKEQKPLGTIGALSLISNLYHDYLLVMNSDILTNLNFESFFVDFIKNKADMSVLSIPYSVNIPYGVIETSDNDIKRIREKPSYTYFSNGGIYLLKKSIINKIPNNTFFNTTDLIELLLENKYKVISYPFSGYWLDIGKHEDFRRAQEDIKHIEL